MLSNEFITPRSFVEIGAALPSSSKFSIRLVISDLLLKPISLACLPKLVSSSKPSNLSVDKLRSLVKFSKVVINLLGRHIWRNRAFLRLSVVFKPDTAAIRIPISPVTILSGKSPKAFFIMQKASVSDLTTSARSKISYPTCKYSLARSEFLS